MTEHLDRDQLRRLTKGNMNSQELVTATRHLADCRQCHGLAEDSFLPATFFLAPADASAHLDAEQMQVYVRQSLDRADREIADGHLEGCSICRDDVAEIAKARPRTAWFPWAGAVAAALVIAFLAWPFGKDRRTTAHVSPSPRQVEIARGYGRSDWDALVSNAMGSGALPVRDDLRELRPPPDAFRGTVTVDERKIEPAGVVVDTSRPQMHWPEVKRAKYRVLLQPWGTNALIQSPPLTSPTWSPSTDLARGTTYQWQVKIERNGLVDIIPAPPAPRALFRVLESDLHDQIEQARSRFASDHLLLAVLYAKVGLERETAEEVDKLAADPATAATAERFRRSISQRR